MNNERRTKMKKISYLLSLLALGLTACSEGYDATDEPKNIITHINCVIDSAEVRSSYEWDGDALGTFWSKDDEILVCNNEGEPGYFVATNENVDQSCRNIADFIGSFTYSGSNELWGIYPSTSATSSKNGFTIKVAASQVRDAGTEFTNWAKYDLKAGYSDNVTSAQTVPTMNFTNLMSIMRVRLRLDASSGFSFDSDEYIESVSIEAPSGASLAGSFSIPFNGDTYTLTPAGDNTNIVTVTFASNLVLNTSDIIEVLVPVAPATLSGSLKVSVKTAKQIISRTFSSLSLGMVANKYYNLNLTKINSANYDRQEIIPIPQNLSVYAVSAGAATITWDPIYDGNTNRKLSAQLKRIDSAWVPIPLVNFKETYSSMYSSDGTTTYLPERITFSKLSPGGTYAVRVKKMGVSDDYYSDWCQFTTPARLSGADFNIDFEDIAGYGAGDVINRCPSTFLDATIVPDTGDADYVAWNDDLLITDGTSTACYRVGDTFGANAINSSNPFNTGIDGVSSQTRAFGRPAYIQLGTTTAQGKLTVDLKRASTGLTNGWTTSYSYNVTFKACAYNTDSNVDLTWTVDMERYTGGTLSGSTTSTIAANRAHTWTKYSINVSARTGVTGRAKSTVLTVTTPSGGGRVLLDDIQITKNN